MNKPFPKSCSRFSQIIERLSTYLSGALFILNLVVIIANVFSRYFFNISPIWTAELARFTLIWAVMIGMNSALYHGEHVSITFLNKILAKGSARIINWLVQFVIIFLMLFMVYYGFRYAINSWKFKTLGLQISKGIPLLAIPIGALLFLLQYIFLQFSLSGKKEGKN
ncbi:TRAP transporter small permease [Halocella sp. SP3-1]|uniref:TRAP transporter small permease n=1 Tax=Halocella sp. SP3-1 TaxID=2382161 RepID=UPI000F74F74A|nr:TRAP transporter small permease [Halocella sp. SP3-1]AZO94258.1 TRAP transporter small permease [Halocella sp. SP3-1]